MYPNTKGEIMKTVLTNSEVKALKAAVLVEKLLDKKIAKHAQLAEQVIELELEIKNLMDCHSIYKNLVATI